MREELDLIFILKCQSSNFTLCHFFYTANSISIRMPTISTPSVVFIKLQEIDCCIKLPKHDLTLTKHSRVGSSWFLINILLENLTTQSFVWAKIILQICNYMEQQYYNTLYSREYSFLITMVKITVKANIMKRS